MAKGAFITLEGGEGCGKSTQTDLLADGLNGVGISTLRTREPGGADGAEEIRNLLVNGASDRWDPVTEALLHYAARREHICRTIQPALNDGIWVICDRFSDSTMAYQGYGQGLGRDRILLLHDIVAPGIQPDLTVILDLPVEIGLKRAAARGGSDRYERMGQQFHHRLREGFLDIAQRDPSRCLVVDAKASVEEVQASIRHIVYLHFGVEIA
jgi:dTMP kinase